MGLSENGQTLRNWTRVTVSQASAIHLIIIQWTMKRSESTDQSFSALFHREHDCGTLVPASGNLLLPFRARLRGRTKYLAVSRAIPRTFAHQLAGGLGSRLGRTYCQCWAGCVPPTALGIASPASLQAKVT